MLRCSTVVAMELYGELVEAYCEQHGFGGDTAEIYSYRLEHYSPKLHSSLIDQNQKLLIEVSLTAVLDLLQIIEEFMRCFECRVKIDGLAFRTWRKKLHEMEKLSVQQWRDQKLSLPHRYHVKVTKK